jgi:large subunit ribosomal protein L21
MYAIVKTGGKQYRVEQGQTLLVERLPVPDGDSVALQPLLFVDGGDVVDGSDLASVTVSARVVAHERGPKLRIVKFKPKRGYKRRNGHRQELTRIEVTEIKTQSKRGGGARKSASASASEGANEAPASASEGATEAPASAAKGATDTPAKASKPAKSAKPKPKPAKPEAAKPEAAKPESEADATPTTEDNDGS